MYVKDLARTLYRVRERKMYGVDYGRSIKRMKELIEKLRKSAGKDKVKGCIVALIEQMLEVAPECEVAVIDNPNGVQQVYDKLRSMRSGSDSEIPAVIVDVYKMPVEFELEMRVVRKSEAAHQNGTQKIIDLLDFMS